MKKSSFLLPICLTTLLAPNLSALDSQFGSLGRWTETATNPNTGAIGDHGSPMTVTWSIVPDGTPMSGSRIEPGTTSSFISLLDGRFDPTHTGGSDLTKRAWFPTIRQAFDRWDELSGLTMKYSVDDGATHKPFGAEGKLGVRGDIRIASSDYSPGSLAYSYYPNLSEMVIKSSTANSWHLFKPSKPINHLNNPYLNNLIAHESGHGLGLPHLRSDNTKQLMEPNLQTSFFGPQMDDILRIHRLYGDKYETIRRNESFQHALNIGNLNQNTNFAIGLDADRNHDQLVQYNEADFVSIDDNSDRDFYKFSLDSNSLLDIALNPQGINFLRNNMEPSGEPRLPQLNYDMTALSNLGFVIYDDAGNAIRWRNSNSKGFSESLNDYFLAAGDYFLRVYGQDDNTQFYSLEINAVAIPEPASLLILSSLLIPLTRRRPTAKITS
ncbi:Matrixin [Poriferisphaera corsica]|uniref:Matrixin n=1 Tax=Poriferisphaera corsica TaxID=2528020 RepID=A0A517YP28_9BACT|nr:matrixin family metalloprotease [Poriferisphaera corsica]QDU31976.1 Matrixin [Poriferisphaera corsica]